MSKSKTVTLPREVVERALDALWNTAHGEPRFGKHVRNSMEALIAAMEQQPNHILDAGNMTLEGWKLVPVEPTQEMLDAYIHMQGRFSSARSDWAAMLAAAPQPQTTVNMQPDPTPYLWYDPENGDTWTQEAIDEGFCVADNLIPLYTKDAE